MLAGLFRRSWRLALGVLAAAAQTGCARAGAGFLDPEGPVAAGQRHLFLVSVLLVLVVITPVIVGVPWVVWRYRHGGNATYRPNWHFSWPLEILAWGVPLAVVAVLSWFLWTASMRLDPYRPLNPKVEPLRVQVVGLDWKWLFIYPDLNVASVNELALPVGRPVRLVLTSDTVMQSLLIPRLAGQIYAMAGMRTQLNLQADHAGRYLGENTQYNGRGFARQKFQAIALPGAQFSRWVGQARQSGLELDCAAYARLERRDSVDAPMHYRAVTAHLFDWIVGKYRAAPMPACAAPADVRAHE